MTERPQERNFGLDLLRAGAILGVLVFHSLSFLNSPPAVLASIAARGWAGVDLFFVLSGYLIGRQVFDDAAQGQPRSLFGRCRVFWVKRWTRTVPLYLVALAFYVIVKPGILNAPFVGGFDWKWLFFMQNFGSIRDFGQTWSLCIEEQFYLVFPLIGFALARSAWWAWAIPLVVSVAYRWSAAHRLGLGEAGSAALTQFEFVSTFRFPTLAMLDGVAVGTILARTYSTWSSWSARARLGIGVAGAAVAIATLSLVPEFPASLEEVMFLYSLLAVSFGGVLVGAETLRSAAFNLGAIRNVALWSYSAYLWHQVFTRLFARYFSDWHWFLQISAYLVAVFVTSLASYEMIEKPGLRLRKLLLR